MKAGLLTGCLFCGLSASLGAQSPSQALTTIAAVGQHVNLDVAREDPGIFTFGGWAFECSSGTQATVELLIDGAVTGAMLFPAAREDVRIWAMTYGVCDFYHTPYYSGVNAWLSVADAHLTVGPHAAQLRIRNVAGVMTLSPPVGFDVK